MASNVVNDRKLALEFKLGEKFEEIDIAILLLDQFAGKVSIWDFGAYHFENWKQ